MISAQLLVTIRGDMIMNIIRSAAVELTTIPAIAYKQKLHAGGYGLRILRLDQEAVAVFSFDKRSGAPFPFGPVNEELFPNDAVEEAIDMTTGMPFSSRGKITITSFELPKDDEDVIIEDEPELVDMVDSDEYKEFVMEYTDQSGKMNYQLMNKDFIQFASRSKAVANMIADGASDEEIVKMIVNSRACLLATRKEPLSDEEVTMLMETLEEIDPRGAFKEINAYLRRQLARAKKQ